jgi:hypothetical protein
MIFFLSALFSMLLLTQACSTAHLTPPAGDNGDMLHAQLTHVEIDYFLGHNQYKLTGDGAPMNAEVTTYLEKNIVQQGVVDPRKYVGFLSQAIAFAEKPRRDPSQETDCRSPFSVVVKIDAKSYTSKGCRSSDEGGLSRLIRDGEFLLYSKK